MAQFTIDTEAASFFKIHTKEMKVPADLALMCEDLKVCGRREFAHLIRLRHKYQAIIARLAKQADQEESKQAAPTEEDAEAEIERALQETMQRVEKEKKRQAKKEKVAKDKSELRKKMSVIATTTLDNDEDLTMSAKLWDSVRKKGFERAGENSEEDESESDGEVSGDQDSASGSDVGESDASDSDSQLDEKAAAVERMADQMEHTYASKKEYAMTVDRRMAAKEAKKKALIEQQRLRLEELDEQQALDNADLLDSDDEEASDAEASDDEDAGKEEGKRAEATAGRDVESSGESDFEGMESRGGLFVNPLAKKGQPAKEDSADEWSDDDDDDAAGSKPKKAKKEKSILGKRKRKGSMDDVQDFFVNEAIEEVPMNDPGTLAKRDGGYESMDSDDIAATRILARRMLRKKARNEIIDASYNRYVTHEDPNQLPSWFVEDEAKHRFCERLQPTKEEMAAEKEAIKAYNARPSKKVE